MWRTIIRLDLLTLLDALQMLLWHGWMANSVDPGQTVRMRRLTWVYTGRIGYKPHFVMVRQHYVHVDKTFCHYDSDLLCCFSILMLGRLHSYMYFRYCFVSRYTLLKLARQYNWVKKRNCFIIEIVIYYICMCLYQYFSSSGTSDWYWR